MTYPEIVQAMKDGKCKGGKIPTDTGTIVLARGEDVVGDIVVVWRTGGAFNNLAYTLRDDWEMVEPVEEVEPDDGSADFITATDVICTEISFPSPTVDGETNYISVTEWPNGMGADVVTVESNEDGRTEQRFGLDFETIERVARATELLRDRMQDRDNP